MLLAALILALPAFPISAMAGGGPEGLHLSCRGEEPFWAIEADGEMARYSEPGAEAVFSGGLEELGWLPPGWLAWRSAAGEPRLALVLRREACYSTMADGPPSSHRAILLLDGRPAAAGCCEVTPPRDAAGPQP
jgi:uncharacterized membrane protein